jgi:hypothetical protein
VFEGGNHEGNNVKNVSATSRINNCFDPY